MMTKRISLIVILGLLSSLCVFSLVQAQIDAFTYFVPYPADALADQFDVAHSDDFSTTPVVAVISISVLRTGTAIYYDHWEDGLEPNITLPVQASTEVFNGLSAGDVIVLRNSVPVPRNAANVLYDGGDKFVSVGGAVAVTLATWPDFVNGVLFADAWELYPTSRWGTSYIIPVGENVPQPNDGFGVVGINVQAVEDGTTVQLDLDANGSFEQTATLNEGEQFTQVSGVRAGARVQALSPVQVHIFTGDPLEPTGYYESRAYTMLPLNRWTNDYVAPRSSDGRYWLYNPDATTSLDVTAQTTAGTTSITISANDFSEYIPGIATGVRFTSTDGRPFYGVAALSDDNARDWGYALLPTSYMSTQALVGWAPGNNNTPPDGDQSRIYATALTTTTVIVDHDNNGTPDGSVLVSPLAEAAIVDAVDHDFTRARLYTTDGVPFIAVYGQDLSATPVLPSIDLGTNVVPLAAPLIHKSYTLVEEGYNCGTVTRGHTVRFQLQAYNDSNDDITGAVIADELGPGIAYVPHSTLRDGVAVGDSGTTPFPLDEGGVTGLSINALGSTTITYDTLIQNAGLFTNRALFVSPSADPATVNLSLPFRVAGYEVAKTLIDPPGGPVSAGQVITFNLAITNTGNVTITQLPLRDQFDANYLTFSSASVLPNSTAPGVITWTTLASLPPTTTVNLSLSFSVVDPLPPNATNTLNVALSEGVRGSDNFTKAIMCDEASVSFAQPPPPPPQPTPKTQKEHEAEPTPTPPAATPTPTATPAVLFLPETGSGDPRPTVPLWLVVLLVPGLLTVRAVRRRRR